MIDLMWDLFQQKQISDLKKTAELSREKDKFQDNQKLSLEIRFNELEKRHEQLKLVTLSMWALLRDHSGLLESDLRKYVEKIDLLDGHADAKVTMKTQKTLCTGCSREVMSTSLVCAYCGEKSTNNNPFYGA